MTDEQIEKSRENKSRAVANAVSQKKNNGKQSVGFVDNRPEAINQRNSQLKLNKERNVNQLQLTPTIQLAYKSINDANVGTMWKARQALGMANKSNMSHNVAKSGNFQHSSDASGHSEQQAIALHLAHTLGQNINVHTEREPCVFCEGNLANLSSATGVNVTAHYLVDYQSNPNHEQDLRNLYGL